MLGIVFFFFLNLMILDFYIFVFSYTQTKRKKVAYLMLGLILFTFIIIYSLTMDLTLIENPGLAYHFIEYIQLINARIYAFIIAVVLIVSLYILHKENTYWRNTITSTSIKESIDNLPMGLCFSTKNGIVLLANNVMNNLSHQIAARELQNTKTFWAKIMESEHFPTLQVDDGQTWSFLRHPIKIGKKDGIQISAINITELEKLRSELKQKNKEYKKMNVRLGQYSENLASMKVIEERLATKTRLHNELGYILLATRRWLVEEDSRADGEMIVTMWEQSVDALLSGAGLEAKGVFEDLSQAASDIGIKLHVDGEFPKNKRVESLILKATIEALNNAIRHADAKNLKLKIKENEVDYNIEFINDGKAPMHDVVEGGGLSRLRKQVESQLATMKIISNPNFKLLINIPKTMEVDDDKRINC